MPGSHRRAVLASQRQARGSRRAHRRRAGRCAGSRALRRGGRSARAAASGIADLSSTPDQPARSRLVAPGGARGEAALVRIAGGAARRRDQVPDGLRHGASCRRAPSTATSSATTCCSRARASPASSTSVSPPPIFSRTTLPSRSMTGASRRTAAPSTQRSPIALVTGLRRVAPALRRRARGMAVAAARRGAALLAVSPVRPALAAPGRADARARPRAFRAYPARSCRRAGPVAAAGTLVENGTVSFRGAHATRNPLHATRCFATKTDPSLRSG